MLGRIIRVSPAHTEQQLRGRPTGAAAGVRAKLDGGDGGDRKEIITSDVLDHSGVGATGSRAMGEGGRVIGAEGFETGDVEHRVYLGHSGGQGEAVGHRVDDLRNGKGANPLVTELLRGLVGEAEVAGGKEDLVVNGEGEVTAVGVSLSSLLLFVILQFPLDGGVNILQELKVLGGS
jgi:hypothetical protein